MITKKTVEEYGINRTGKFRTSKGEIVSGEQLQNAREPVAKRYETYAANKRAGEWGFAPHVTAEQIEESAQKDDILASEIRKGLHDNHFWCWQSINEELTGECIAFLPK